MRSIGKYFLAVFSIILMTLLFTACDDTGVKMQNSGSRDGFASLTPGEKAANEKNSSAYKDIKSSKTTDLQDNGSLSSEKLSKENNNDEKKHKIVMVDDCLYMETGYVVRHMKCGTPDGEILTTDAELPKKNDESNFGTGYEYQRSSKGHLNVKIDGRWHDFQNVAISSMIIPDGVANFEAEIIEADGESLLIKITNLPSEFSYIFGNKKTEELKPVLIILDDSQKFRGIKKLKRDELKSKKIKLWFDGEIKGAKPELSNPIELGEIYEISVLEKDK